MLVGCKDPFQIECNCHLPVRDVVNEFRKEQRTHLQELLKEDKEI